jgi:DNA-binding beta-propeller fold protein YncE
LLERNLVSTALRYRPWIALREEVGMMRVAASSFAIAVSVALAACGSTSSPQETGQPAPEPEPGPSPARDAAKVYVALEDGMAVAVLDGEDLSVLSKIDVGDFMAHNVQVAPDGKTVWATLMAMEMPGMAMDDEVVVIDPATDRITKRISLGPEVHPAHVVLSPDSKIAYVTGNAKNEVIRIDASKQAILDRTPLGKGEGAHGERVSPDGSTLWVAEIGGKCVAKFPTGGGDATHIDLEGQAVQTAVTKDGKWAFASIYDTKRVARIDAASSVIDYATLPADSQGPVQLYPTPDNRTILVADQGVLAGRPASNKLYFVDAATLDVTGAADVGQGAHGVVAFADRAYVTGTVDGTVTAVDLATRAPVATAKLGANSRPNGISVWTAGAGTP